MNASKRYLLGDGVVAVILIGLTVGAIRPSKYAQAAPTIVPDIEVVQVQQQDVPIVHEWIGTFDGLVNADVRAQVTGYLLKQGYEEGAFVKKGQLLFQIDIDGEQTYRDYKKFRTTSKIVGIEEVQEPPK